MDVAAFTKVFSFAKDVWGVFPREVKENSSPVMMRDPATGITREEWRKDGKLDRIRGPAVIVCDPATDTVIMEEWYEDGKRNRADGPAVTERSAVTGIVTREEWYRDGKRDRANGPAVTARDPATGSIIFEAWYENGEKTGFSIDLPLS